MASTCRARVYAAACQKPDAILAFATNGILSRKPLKLTVPEGVRDWDLEVFEEATLVQSGVYPLRRPDGTWVTLGRRFAERSIPWEEVLGAWRAGAQTLDFVGKQQFIGLGAVLPGCGGRSFSSPRSSDPRRLGRGGTSFRRVAGRRSRTRPPAPPEPSPPTPS
jgi:hypothetical protein